MGQTEERRKRTNKIRQTLQFLFLNCNHPLHYARVSAVHSSSSSCNTLTLAESKAAFSSAVSQAGSMYGGGEGQLPKVPKGNREPGEEYIQLMLARRKRQGIKH